MSRYSAGPWRVVKEGEELEIQDAAGNSLMCNLEFYPWVPDNEDDWYLIAASPEMFESLKAMDRLIMNIARHIDLGEWELVHKCLDEIRQLQESAITKAENKR